MEKLLSRGAKHFKFVDRTFNLKPSFALAIVEFFRERWFEGLFLHFEMVPDRMPEEILESIAKFPPGAIQFEVGLQTLNPKVAANIHRRTNLEKAERNIRYCSTQTGVHIHSDLIVGLPGEDIHSFQAGFDRLVGWEPHEIQVGILKRLQGTPIAMNEQLIFSDEPPYTILKTPDMSFETIEMMRRFAKHWDIFANQGNFPRVLKALLERKSSAFDSFLEFSTWLFENLTNSISISIQRQAEALYHFLIDDGVRGHVAIQDDATKEAALRIVMQDFLSQPGRNLPGFVQKLDVPPLFREELKTLVRHANERRAHYASTPERQRKHLRSRAIAD